MAAAGGREFRYQTQQSRYGRSALGLEVLAGGRDTGQRRKRNVGRKQYAFKSDGKEYE